GGVEAVFRRARQRHALEAVQVGAVLRDRVGIELGVGVGIAQRITEAVVEAAGQFQFHAAGAGRLPVGDGEEAPDRGGRVDLRVLPVHVEQVGVVGQAAGRALHADLVVAHGVGLVAGPGRVLGEVADGRGAV